jgi:hypothetical protein
MRRRGPGGRDRRIRFPGLLALVALGTGCGSYSEFTLPGLAGGNPNVAFRFEEQPAPVLSAGRARDVLNPSVVGRWHVYYSAWDGRTWRTVHAFTPDLRQWRDLGVVLEPDPQSWEGSYIAANGSALEVGGAVWYWYVAGPRDRPRLGLARDWHKLPGPVLDPGPYMSWDERGVADPDVLRIGRYFYLYYLGQDRATRQRIGVARSTDGIHWEKLVSNPILELGAPGAFDENGLGEPAVWQARGFYWMLYTGRGAGEIRRLGLARSADGVHWTKLPQVFAGASAWDSKVMCDPGVERLDDSTVGVWFGGGDIARPDENLHGQVGYGVLHMTQSDAVPAAPQDRRP